MYMYLYQTIERKEQGASRWIPNINIIINYPHLIIVRTLEVIKGLHSPWGLPWFPHTQKPRWFRGKIWFCCDWHSGSWRGRGRRTNHRGCCCSSGSNSCREDICYWLIVVLYNTWWLLKCFS